MYNKIMILILFVVLGSIFIVPTIYSVEKINLTITLYTADDKPLSNALVIVKPSRYSSSSWSNITDENGTARFYGVELTISNTVYVEVNYGVYEKICSIRQLDVEDRNITLYVPFETLYININVVDEYLKPINATYTLYYENHPLINNKIINGKLIINGTVDHQLLLINSYLYTDNWNYVSDITYRLEIKTDTYLESMEINSNNLREKIIIDNYKPYLEIINSTIISNKLIPYFKWIYLYIGVNDGVYTDYVDINIESKGVKWVLINETIESNMKISCWKTAIDLKHYSNEYLLINITARDHSGKYSFLLETIYLGSKTNTTDNNTVSNRGNNMVSNTPSNSKVSNVNETSSGNETLLGTSIGSEFSPPSISSGSEYWFNSVYLVGVFISFIIILIEIKRYRLERDSFE
ncbi:MAG: hypothetical protein B6U89_02050 [Desulfurococcales archaeon ex4484_58]|nr:MAG: hypothetical protein B6U89_02050 [Desulfurococcales archaeon ex4484_58]